MSANPVPTGAHPVPRIAGLPRLAAVPCPPDGRLARRPLLATRMAFGAYLRAVRESRGVSQQELCRRAGLSHSLLSRWESGARSPERDTLLRVSRALGLRGAAEDALLALARYLPASLEGIDWFDGHLQWCLERVRREARDG